MASWPRTRELGHEYTILDCCESLGFRPEDVIAPDLESSFQNKFIGEENVVSTIVDGKTPEQVSAEADGLRLEIVYLMYSIRGWNIFHTEPGHFGLVPKSAEPGDIICVMARCNVPVVLRRRDSHYIHLGTCYVPGFMEGEAVKDVENGLREIQQFEIR